MAAGFRLLKGLAKILASGPLSYYYYRCRHISRCSKAPSTTFKCLLFSDHQSNLFDKKRLCDGRSLLC